jgi:hypothetical protein
MSSTAQWQEISDGYTRMLNISGEKFILTEILRIQDKTM